MPRLDVRVKTRLQAWVTHYKGETEKKVAVHDLSISGLLMDGWTPKINDPFFMRLELSEGNGIEMFGNSIRIRGMGAAAQFYFPERETLLKLWDFIKGRIHDLNICPYCNEENKPHSEYCEKCGWYLNFRDQEYLSKHLQETFLQRINNRIVGLYPGRVQKVLNLLDKELLAKKGISLDEQFVGTSSAMLEVFSIIRKVALTENPVLILGESGTGKDLTARAIHERSHRKSGPYVVINCTTIPEGLLESELFGYEKGAFTGAYMSRKGKFELANSGTVFLDEIAELPSPLQAKLLRVLEDKIVERLGGRSGRKVDVRIITATNKNLEQEVTDGRFRIDLYHRINTFTITLPPFRERGEDKTLIAKYYLKKFCSQEGVSKHFSKEALEAINLYPWPGNVREIINKVRRAIVISETNVLTQADLSIEAADQKTASLLREVKAGIEKQRLLEVLEKTSNNVSKAARLLGISRPTLYALRKKYGLKS